MSFTRFPALTDLKAARPEIEIDWLVEEALRRSFAGIPGSQKCMRSRSAACAGPVELARLIRHRAGFALRCAARRYDLVLDVQGP